MVGLSGYKINDMPISIIMQLQVQFASTLTLYVGETQVIYQVE